MIFNVELQDEWPLMQVCTSTRLNMICLSELIEAPFMDMPSPSREKTLLEAPNGLQHIQYSAGKLGTAHY